MTVASDRNEARIRGLYDVLESRRAEALPGYFADNVRFHTIRPMPPTTYTNKREFLGYLAEVSRTMPEDGDIRLLKIAADGDYVFVVHLEAEGTPREHRHMMVYRLADDQIAEAWELTLVEAETAAPVLAAQH